MNRTTKFFTVMMSLMASAVIMAACTKDENDDNNIVNPPVEETISLSNTQWYYEEKDTLVMEEYNATVIYDLIATYSFESDTNGIYMSDGIMEMEIDGESIEDVICNTDHFTYTFDGKQNGATIANFIQISFHCDPNILIGFVPWPKEATIANFIQISFHLRPGHTDGRADQFRK